MITLRKVCANGDLDEVKRIIEEGGDAGHRDEYGSRPLIIASSKRHLELIKYLIEKGGLELIKYLIEKGGDVLEGDNYGVTPLHVASWWTSRGLEVSDRKGRNGRVLNRNFRKGE